MYNVSCKTVTDVLLTVTLMFETIYRQDNFQNICQTLITYHVKYELQLFSLITILFQGFIVWPVSVDFTESTESGPHSMSESICLAFRHIDSVIFYFHFQFLSKSEAIVTGLL